MLVEKQTIEWLIALGRKLESAQVLDPGYVERIVQKVIPRFQGGDILYFILAEDANVTGRAFVYAHPATLNETTGEITASSTTLIKLWNWQLILSSPKYAKAGYAGIRSSNNIFVNGPCVSGCQANGSINVASIPDGEVGTAYSHVVTGTHLHASTIEVASLPPGLTFNTLTDTISGTPTTAGTYLVKVTATSNNNCPITNITEVVIAPETP